MQATAVAAAATAAAAAPTASSERASTRLHPRQRHWPATRAAAQRNGPTCQVSSPPHSYPNPSSHQLSKEGQEAGDEGHSHHVGGAEEQAQREGAGRRGQAPLDPGFGGVKDGHGKDLWV